MTREKIFIGSKANLNFSFEFLLTWGSSTWPFKISNFVNEKFDDDETKKTRLRRQNWVKVMQMKTFWLQNIINFDTKWVQDRMRISILCHHASCRIIGLTWIQFDDSKGRTKMEKTRSSMFEIANDMSIDDKFDKSRIQIWISLFHTQWRWRWFWERKKIENILLHVINRPNFIQFFSGTLFSKKSKEKGHFSLLSINFRLSYSAYMWKSGNGTHNWLFVTTKKPPSIIKRREKKAKHHVANIKWVNV